MSVYISSTLLWRSLYRWMKTCKQFVFNFWGNSSNHQSDQFWCHSYSFMRNFPNFFRSRVNIDDNYSQRSTFSQLFRNAFFSFPAHTRMCHKLESSLRWNVLRGALQWRENLGEISSAMIIYLFHFCFLLRGELSVVRRRKSLRGSNYFFGLFCTMWCWWGGGVTTIFPWCNFPCES